MEHARHRLTFGREALAYSADAFTLVELLVVVGIIAVLIAILVPALNRSRETAIDVRCRANLQQIGQAMQMYSNENRDMYPDRLTLGGDFQVLVSGRLNTYGWGYRAGIARRYRLDVPSAYPEFFGLPSLLHGVSKLVDVDGVPLPKPRYLKGDSGVWVCPAASDSMREIGNTYAWSQAANVAGSTSQMRSKRQATDWVWDNFTFLPAPSGQRFGLRTDGFSIPLASQRTPHGKMDKVRKGKINILTLGGHVTERVFKASSTDPAPQ